MHTTEATSPSISAASAKRTRRLRLCIGAFVVLVLAPLAAWLLRPASAIDLGHGHRLQKAGVYTQWASGNVVVLIRHAERCDRSSSQCLGDPTGITMQGARVASVAGQALDALGMATTDVVSSPLVRTVQTSEAMFGHPVRTENWLQDCRDPALKDVTALKRPGRNLVVVTHSGCIDHYERQLGVGSTPSSGYVSALFVSQPENGKPHVLGYLDAPAWQTLMNQANK